MAFERDTEGETPYQLQWNINVAILKMPLLREEK